MLNGIWLLNGGNMWTNLSEDEWPFDSLFIKIKKRHAGAEQWVCWTASKLGGWKETLGCLSHNWFWNWIEMCLKIDLKAQQVLLPYT